MPFTNIHTCGSRIQNIGCVGMTKEEVFEAAKALAEEEGCTYI